MNRNMDIMLIILNIVMVFLSAYLSVHYYLEGTQGGLICGILWTLATVCWIGCTVFNTINAVRRKS